MHDRNKRPVNRRKKWLPYLLVSPYLLFVSIFVGFPVLFCFFLTFHKWNIISPMHFIGADNYTRLLHDRLFWKAIGNTLRFLLLHIPLQLVVSLFLAQLLNQNPESSTLNIFLPAGFLLIAFFLALFTVRQTLSGAVQTDRKLFPPLLSWIKFPVKFGELLKKDFIYSWKILDCWLSLLGSVFYAILLIAGNFSFESFSIAIAVIVMLSGSLAFNSLGLENNSGIERLSGSLLGRHVSY